MAAGGEAMPCPPARVATIPYPSPDLTTCWPRPPGRCPCCARPIVISHVTLPWANQLLSISARDCIRLCTLATQRLCLEVMWGRIDVDRRYISVHVVYLLLCFARFGNNFGARGKDIRPYFYSVYGRRYPRTFDCWRRHRRNEPGGLLPGIGQSHYFSGKVR